MLYCSNWANYWVDLRQKGEARRELAFEAEIDERRTKMMDQIPNEEIHWTLSLPLGAVKTLEGNAVASRSMQRDSAEADWLAQCLPLISKSQPV